MAGDLKAQRRAILDDARREAKEILSEANARIERTILEIRKVQAEKEKTKLIRNELKDFMESAKSESGADGSDSRIKQLRHKSRKPNKPEPQPKIQSSKPVEPGDFVTLDGGNTVGEVMSVSGKKAEVAFGALRTIVELSRLKPSGRPKKTTLSSVSVISASTSDASRRRQLAFRNEIDVRGMRADEALQAVTYFIDDAIQFNAGKVRILHGTGHGILKTLIRQQLKTVPGVESFEDEDIRFGGAGITVVALA